MGEVSEHVKQWCDKFRQYRIDHGGALPRRNDDDGDTRRLAVQLAQFNIRCKRALSENHRPSDLKLTKAEMTYFRKSIEDDVVGGAAEAAMERRGAAPIDQRGSPSKQLKLPWSAVSGAINNRRGPAKDPNGSQPDSVSAGAFGFPPDVSPIQSGAAQSEALAIASPTPASTSLELPCRPRIVRKQPQTLPWPKPLPSAGTLPWHGLRLNYTIIEVLVGWTARTATIYEPRRRHAEPRWQSR